MKLLKKKRQGKTSPESCRAEAGACAANLVTLPCGYEKREPTCDGKL
jgi:hypothetical protein